MKAWNGQSVWKEAEDGASTRIRVGIGHKMGCWAGGMIEDSPRG